MKGIYILHEGIPSTIFESQVLNHILEMNKKGIDFEIISFNTENKIFLKSKEMKKKINYRYPKLKIKLLKSISIYYPLAFILHFFQLVYCLKNKRFDFIHSRSDYSQFISLMIKPFIKSRFIWDCRGDSVDELKFAVENKSFLIKLYYWLYLKNFQNLIVFLCKKYSDSCIYVSEDLKIIRKIKSQNNIVVPCCSSTDLFYYSQKIRQLNRKKMNYNPKDKIFIYVGSMVPYQSIELFNDLINKINNSKNYKFLVVTSDLKKASLNFKSVKREKITILMSDFNEINKYYNVADFAILIRSDRSLNHVASPTKFGEYCLTGLPVIMNNTVKQSESFSKIIGNKIDFSEMNLSKKIDRENVSNRSKQFFDRTIYANDYVKLYSYV